MLLTRNCFSGLLPRDNATPRIGRPFGPGGNRFGFLGRYTKRNQYDTMNEATLTENIPKAISPARVVPNGIR